MGTMFRVMASFIGVGACLAASIAFQPTWQPSRKKIATLVEPRGEIAEVIHQRITAKTKIVDRLVAGEMTLLEAAAWFRHLNETPPEYRCDYRRQWPGKSDGEKLCRQVIVWAGSNLRVRMSESQVEGVLCRLQGDLEMLLADREELELPW